MIEKNTLLENPEGKRLVRRHWYKEEDNIMMGYKIGCEKIWLRTGTSGGPL
jgi:hypothetical protein